MPPATTSAEVLAPIQARAVERPSPSRAYRGVVELPRDCTFPAPADVAEAAANLEAANRELHDLHNAEAVQRLEEDLGRAGRTFIRHCACGAIITWFRGAAPPDRCHFCGAQVRP